MHISAGILAFVVVSVIIIVMSHNSKNLFVLPLNNGDDEKVNRFLEFIADALFFKEHRHHADVRRRLFRKLVLYHFSVQVRAISRKVGIFAGKKPHNVQYLTGGYD